LELADSRETPGAGRYWDVPLAIDVAGLPAGEYTTTLSFVSGGGTVKVPVKILVRHPVYWPALVLLFGIAAGLGLSRYRAYGRPRDLLLTQLGTLRALLQQDALLRDGIPLDEDEGGERSAGEVAGGGTGGRAAAMPDVLANPFRDKAEGFLLTAELGLQSEQLDAARTQLQQAAEVLRTWSQARLEWSKQLAYLARLQNKLGQGGGDESSFRQQQRRRLADLIDGAPLQKSPQTLREAAVPLVERLGVQQQIVARIVDLESQASKLAAPAWRSWQARCAALRRRADGLGEGQAAVEGLQAELAKAEAELGSELSANAGDTPDSADDAPMTTLHSAALGSTPSSGIEPVPETQLGRLTGNTPGRAAWRLQVFLIGTYGIMLLLLAGAGLNEVYAKRPTFGADLLGDYLTLLLWGFGAEATRDSIAAALRGGATAADKLSTERGESSGAAATP
ncbi:MAG TPA: hypothetical protein PKI03_18740, partial [Pseudomonadota bacterium]|nr:hypothetical protein [Pseudomonadota bacterium]